MGLTVPSLNFSISISNNISLPIVTTEAATENISSYGNDSLKEQQISQNIEQFTNLLEKMGGLSELIEIFEKIIQGPNEMIKHALVKPEGYFRRLFSTENWEAWTEHRTSLGKVVSVFANYVKKPFPIENHLDSNEFQQANAQAKNLLPQLNQIENHETRISGNIDANDGRSSLQASLTSFDNFLTRIFSFIPGAQANSIEWDSECLHPVIHCKIPGGTYSQTCFPPTVQYLPDLEACQLETSCKSIYSAMPPIPNQLNFKPEDSFTLENRNGTLTIAPSLSPEEANAKLGKHFKDIKEIDQKLSDGTIGNAEREKLKLNKEELQIKQGAIIGSLTAGDIITLDHDGQPTIITSDNKAIYNQLYHDEAFKMFQELAKSTGGIMGLSSDPKYLTSVAEKMFEHILQNMAPDELLDIAFVLDTTGSMSDDIEEVKNSLTKFLGQLKERTVKSGNTFRVAILEYRDKNEDFLNRVTIDFTSDLNKVSTALKKVYTSGGGDNPEAVFDALLAAQDQLAWGHKTKHVTLLIGDAPPHPKTVDGRHDEKDVTKKYQTKDINIAVYPIIANVRKSD